VSLDLDLGFVVGSSGARLERRIARWPYVVGRVLGGALVVQQSGGGLHDGDRRVQRVVATCDVGVRGQGAVLVHPPSRGETRGVRESLELAVDGNALLQHVSETRLLLPGSRLRTETTVRPGRGCVVVAESLARHPSPGPAPEAVTELRVVDRSGELLAVDRSEFPDVHTGFDVVGSVAVLGRAGEPLVPEIDGVVAAASELPRGAGFLVRWCARDVAAGRRFEGAVLASVRQGENSLPQREHRGLGAAADPEFGQHVFDVGGDGAPAGVQFPGDLVVGGP